LHLKTYNKTHTHTNSPLLKVDMDAEACRLLPRAEIENFALEFALLLPYPGAIATMCGNFNSLSFALLLFYTLSLTHSRLDNYRLLSFSMINTV
jgi:hypothetical protein